MENLEIEVVQIKMSQYSLSKNQAEVLKKLARDNGFTEEEISAHKGSDFALYHKMINGIIPLPKSEEKRKLILTKWSFMKNFNIMLHKNAPAPEKEIVAVVEMPNPVEKVVEKIKFY